MKLCTACNVEKYEDEFYIRSGRNTLRSECKDCTYERNRREPANPGLRSIRPEPTGVFKHCAKCEREIDTAFFHRCTQNSDGLHSYCKACRSESHITVEESWIRPNDPAPSPASPSPEVELLPRLRQTVSQMA